MKAIVFVLLLALPLNLSAALCDLEIDSLKTKKPLRGGAQEYGSHPAVQIADERLRLTLRWSGWESDSDDMYLTFLPMYINPLYPHHIVVTGDYDGKLVHSITGETQGREDIMFSRLCNLNDYTSRCAPEGELTIELGYVYEFTSQPLFVFSQVYLSLAPLYNQWGCSITDNRQF